MSRPRIPLALGVLAVLVGLPAGCQLQRSEDELVARYRGGDGLGYNIDLELRRTGTFSCSWTGCAGTLGRARGKWAYDAGPFRVGQLVFDGLVHFSSSREHGALSGYLRWAYVMDGGEGPVLVLDQHLDYSLTERVLGLVRSE